jgi:hypothetical protein
MGPWFACKLHAAAVRVIQHSKLPEHQQGRGGKHALLLDQDSVLQAIQTHISILPPGTVS